MTTHAIEIPGYVAGTWDIDPVRSRIGFAARHMVVSKVHGRFDKFHGRIFTAEDPMRSWAIATVNVNSVNTGDKTRDDDLRSGNFFAAATNPIMSYRSTGIRRHGKDLVIDGELTVHGTTRPLLLKVGLNAFATDPDGSIRTGFSATGQIKRADFLVCSNEPYLGLASDKIHLEIEVSAVLRTED
jgi:polyisoprenoid-binding protein YceI